METEIKSITINGVEYIAKADAPKLVDTTGMVYCIIRSRDQGVICGYVDKPEQITSRCVTVHSARQIWAWDSSFVLMDLAENGPRKIDAMQMSAASSQPFRMLEACGIYICADGGKSLRDVPAMVKK